MEVFIASGPWMFCGDGSAYRRVVLREWQNGYVVHNEYCYEDGDNAFGDGSYFTSPGADNLTEAIKRWQERVQSTLDKFPLANMTVKRLVRYYERQFV